MRALPTPAIRLLAAAALLATLGLSSCSSSPKDAAPTKTELQARNRTFLLQKANFDRRQATCVSKQVNVDLSQVLSKAVGDADATKKDGYDQFARAVHVCITQDRSLTTTSR